MVNEMDSMSVFVDFLNTHTSPHAKIAALTHVLLTKEACYGQAVSRHHYQ